MNFLFRKEYPPHVQKFESNPVRLSRPQGVGKCAVLFVNTCEGF